MQRDHAGRSLGDLTEGLTKERMEEVRKAVQGAGQKPGKCLQQTEKVKCVWVDIAQHAAMQPTPLLKAIVISRLNYLPSIRIQTPSPSSL